MHKIGYRVKPALNTIEQFVELYAKLFKTMEVKIDVEMLHAFSVEHFNELLFSVTSLSFHLPKKALYESIDYKVATSFLNMVSAFREKVFVTHYYPNLKYNKNFAINIYNCISSLNAKLGVENIEVNSGLFQYLMDLKNFAIEYGFNVCVDIGHLFYSALQDNIPYETVIEFFLKDNWWQENVIEIHVHDFNECGCHNNIGTGNLGKTNFQELIRYFSFARSIIIETTVKDLRIQGINEVMLLEGWLNENADNRIRLN